MAHAARRVGIIIERRRLKSPWAECAWLPIAALPDEPATPVWTEVGGNSDRMHFYAGAADVELYRTETAHYRDNLESGRPSIWVLLRTVAGEPPVELASVTADPSEGEAMTEAGGETVEPVPMPIEVQTWVAAFVREHHVERPFFKRRRDQAGPDTRDGPAPSKDAPDE